ncbi:MAG: amino acid permease, partial [Gaiella sp.]
AHARAQAERLSVARKVLGFERVLGTRELFAIASGEIGSSLYFALGIVAAAALGFTPLVLLGTGALFLLVAPSYAELASAVPEVGGAETFTRRAFNDLVGFVAGWALLLDYLIVIALSALFLPHYLGVAIASDQLRESPWDIVLGAFAIAVIAIARLIRHTRMHGGLFVFAALDMLVQALIVVLGLAFLLDTGVLGDGLSLAAGQSWNDVLFAIPLGLLAYTGLETVANYAQEVEDPGRDLPRGMLGGIGLVVVLSVVIAAIGLSAFPAGPDGTSPLAEEWLEAPMAGVVTSLDGELPSAVVDVLRVVVGLSGFAILFGAAATGLSGCTRLVHSMAEHRMLPRELGRFERRSLVSSEAIVLIALGAIAIVVLNGIFGGDDAEFLASAYSFGVLVAFGLAQAAAIRLRRTEPDLPRPFRARPDVRIAGTPVPLAALLGLPLTAGVFVLALVTHPGARYAGPLWLLAGLAAYWATRWWNDRGVLEDVDPLASLPAGVGYRKILVPMKLGEIGEEMVATAVALAEGRATEVEAITVVRVPRRFPLQGDLPTDVQERADAALEEARLLGHEHGVEVTTDIVRSRSIEHAVVAEAAARGADLIVLGSAPRWRRQSRFFSPTVDFVLRNAPCEVLVVAFPEGILEEE